MRRRNLWLMGFLSVFLSNSSISVSPFPVSSFPFPVSSVSVPFIPISSFPVSFPVSSFSFPVSSVSVSVSSVSVSVSGPVWSGFPIPISLLTITIPRTILIFVPSRLGILIIASRFVVVVSFILPPSWSIVVIVFRLSGAITITTIPIPVPVPVPIATTTPVSVSISFALLLLSAVGRILNISGSEWDCIRRWSSW